MDLTIKERKTLNTYGAHIYISPQSDKLEFSEGKIILLPRYIWDVFLYSPFTHNKKTTYFHKYSPKNTKVYT